MSSETENQSSQETEGGLGKEENVEDESKRKIAEISLKIAQQIIKAIIPTLQEIKTEFKTFSDTLKQSEEECNKMVTELVDAIDLIKVTNNEK